MGDQVILERGLLDLAQGVAEAFGLYASPPQALAREDWGQAQPADVLQRIYRTKRVCVFEPILSYPRPHDYRAAFRRRSYASAPLADKYCSERLHQKPLPSYTSNKMQSMQAFYIKRCMVFRYVVRGVEKAGGHYRGAGLPVGERRS
jgi:hypothetical protein